MTDRFNKIDDADLIAEVAHRIKNHGEKRTEARNENVRLLDRVSELQARLNDMRRHRDDADKEIANMRAQIAALRDQVRHQCEKREEQSFSVVLQQDKGFNYPLQLDHVEHRKLVCGGEHVMIYIKAL